MCGRFVRLLAAAAIVLLSAFYAAVCYCVVAVAVVQVLSPSCPPYFARL